MLRQNKNTLIFLGLLLLAGVMNLASRMDNAALNNLKGSLNCSIMITLLLFWLQTVHARLLPSAAKSYMIAAGVFLFLYLALRTFKYFMTANVAIAARYAVYAYWLPQMFVPTLFLMVSVCVQQGNEKKEKRGEMLFLIPAGLLSIVALTNDLHELVYRPTVDLSSFTVKTGTYSWGPCFYVMYVWMAAAVILGVIPLLKRMGKQSKKALLALSGMIAFWIGAIALFVLLQRISPYRLFTVPEIHTFCMLGVFEVCIRVRLFPYNENYMDFFSQLSIPALITDRELRPVYQTASSVTADRELLKAALQEPAYPDEDTRLSGMPVMAGYAFWTEDETELNRERRRLASANELLSEENSLIAAENSLRERKRQLDAQNRVYDRIAAALYPRQKRIESLLSEAKPDSEAFRRNLGICCVLNAWCKRESNLLLLSEEALPKRNRELFLALQESARFLKCCGVTAAAVGEEYADFSLGEICRLYETFETILEAWLPALRTMTVSLAERGVRLALEMGQPLPLPDTSLPVSLQEREGIVFVTIHAPKGGEGTC